MAYRHYDDCFGGRLSHAEELAGYSSAEAIVADMNAILETNHQPLITVKSYRNWKRIGTELETSIRKYPHPAFYSVFCGITGVTGYWLFYGDQSGAVKLVKDLPLKNQQWIDEQLEAISCHRRRGLIQEVIRVVGRFSERQRQGLMMFLRMF